MGIVWSWFGFAAQEVTFSQHTQTVTCGDSVLLCTIKLSNSNATFANYDVNKCTVSYEDDICHDDTDVSRNRLLCVKEINESRNLDVYCDARRAGKATVKLDLGEWYKFTGKSVKLCDNRH